MALKSAVWVHGTIVQVEEVSGGGGLAIRELRQGFGTTFIANNASYFFHFPIAAPIILDNIRPKLDKAFVLYHANDAEIKSVHIFDGVTRIVALNNLSLTGQHNGGIDVSNTFLVNPSRAIMFGLGITVGVTFTKPWDGFILFSAAGADFQTP